MNENKTENKNVKKARRPSLKVILILLLAAGVATSAALYLRYRASGTAEEKDIIIDYKNALSKYFKLPPILYLEVRDATKLIEEYEKSEKKRVFLQSKSYDDFEKSKLFRKLELRFKALEKFSGFSVSLDSVKKFTGKRTAFLLFDIGELYFVFISELTEKQWLTSNLYHLKDQYESREYLGHTYYIKEDRGGTMVFAFTFVGSKALVSNNPDFFFAYLEDLKNGRDVFGNASKAFSDIFGVKTGGRELVMYLDRDSINNLYFNNYWIYDNEADFKYLLNVLITADRTTGGFEEKRIVHFATGSCPLPSKGDPGHLLKSVSAANPSYAESENNSDSKDIAEKIFLEMFSRIPPREEAKKNKRNDPFSDTVRVIGAGEPLQYAYFAGVEKSDAPFMRLSRGVAVKLNKPRSVKLEKLNRVLAGVYDEDFKAPGSDGFSFKKMKSGGGTQLYELEVPLFKARSITTGLKGDTLLICNSAAAAEAILGKVKENGGASKESSDRIAVYSIPAISESYMFLANEMSATNKWSESGRELFRDNIGGLTALVWDVNKVTVRQKVKNDTLIENVIYELR